MISPDGKKALATGAKYHVTNATGWGRVTVVMMLQQNASELPTRKLSH
jgi:hypothetical protein